MANAVAQELSEVTILRKQNQNTRWTVQKNVEGISHEESLIHPHPAGNSMNWVIGHLVCIYGKILPALGQQPVIEYESVKRYDRGSAPITSATALQFGSLLEAWEQTCNRVDTGLASLSADALDAKAPFSPADNSNETLRSLIGTILFHQAYHAGQTGLLRRVAGKAGAI
jgi:uncharacterized damage-inducible protein DinB